MILPSNDILLSNILIVDDQQANIRLLERMLNRAGYVSVTSTMNPLDVCELHRQNHYDPLFEELARERGTFFYSETIVFSPSGNFYGPAVVASLQP